MTQCRVYKLEMEGATCGACVESIETILQKSKTIQGLKRYKVNNNGFRYWLTLEIDPGSSQTPEDLKKEVKEELGAYSPNLNSFYEEKADVKAPEPAPDHRIRNHLMQGAVGMLLGMIALVFMTLMGLNLYFLPYPGMILMTVAGILVSMGIGWKSSKQAVEKMWQHGSLTMDLLFMVSAVAAVAISIAHLIVPGLPMMIDAALLIFGFRHIGHAIKLHTREQVYQRYRFEDKLSDTYDGVLPNGSTVPISRHELLPGMVILLKPGQMLPFDGESVSEGLVDASNITGERECHVKVKQFLRSGMVVRDKSDPIQVKLTADKSKSFIYAYDQIRETSDQKKAPVEERGDRYASYLLPSLLVLSIIAGSIVSLFFPWVSSLRIALYMLVAACPCVFGMITPLAVYLGLVKSSEKGLTFKDHAAFEHASEIDVAVFDIFGTLTDCDVKVGEHTVPEQYYVIVAALEADAKHEIGTCIHDFVSLNKAMKPIILENKNPKHNGISAVYDKKRYAIGDQNYLIENKLINDASTLPQHGDCNCLTEDGVLVGYFDMVDTIRPEAKECIAALKSMGIDIHLATGKSESIAHFYAKALGVNLKNVHAGCLPENKYHVVKNLSKNGKRVMMVGDGGNDAGALKESHLGVAVTSLQSKNDLVNGDAHAILNDACKLMAIPLALKMSEQTMRHIDRTLLFSIGYNIASLVFAACAIVYFPGHLNPALGALIMVVQTAWVLGNTLLFKSRAAPTFVPAMKPSPCPNPNRVPVQLSLPQQEGNGQGLSVYMAPFVKAEVSPVWRNVNNLSVSRASAAI